MALKSFKPTTSTRRFTVLSAYDDITKHRPEKSLTLARKSMAGRNSAGRVSVRHRGGGVRRKIRIIDFHREKYGIPAKVVGIEYDPNRSARIALLYYRDGEKRYIIAPEGLKVGTLVMSGPDVEPMVGNALPLDKIPMGVPIHNIELTVGAGAQMVRGAGQLATIMAREGEFAQVKLPSGEIRRVNIRCMATVGQVGNLEHESISLGKAGRKRWLGIRPTVRGVAMNPVDHPMGGGEGRTSGGGHPVSPWGQLSKGKKTRKPRRTSDRFILKRRK